jgi:RNA polymerase sigma factor (sigma-70 family)
LVDDLVQDAMLTVWRKAALFDSSKAGAATWIFTIARNLYIDQIRRERRPQFNPYDPALIPDTQPADSGIIQAQREVLLREALMGLPAEQRKVLELAIFAEKPHSAIAKELDVPVGTVKSRTRLALRRIRGPVRS